MKLNDKIIKENLLKGDYVAPEDIEKAEKFAKGGRSSILDYLLTEGLVTKDLVGQAISESFGVPYADLNSNQATRDQVLKIPEVTAKKYRVVLFNEQEKEVTVATDDPINQGLGQALAKIFPKRKIFVSFALPEDIEATFVNYQKPLATRFSKIIEKQNRVAPEIIEEIFKDALVYRASDIHFEPQNKEIMVRFRVDGVLHEAGRLPRDHYENVLNRIKVQSGIRIDEHFKAQDGSMQFERDGRTFDFRTSIVPTVQGEKVVLRVLGSYVQGLVLGELGLNSKHQEALATAAKKPFGMIIIVGPTGSGKTTTLYALLKLLNLPDTNITTIEDPVEYKMLGVNQIQVNEYTGLTFAKGLRSIVRQDPDIILVGEVRDEETAEISVNASLTGHLLLTTFHANNAATAIPRLLDMAIEPFLLASTLELVIAQRLVRRICDQCRYSTSVTLKDITSQKPGLEKFFPSPIVTLYKGKGCSSCGDTGYRGRTAIFEFIQITSEMQELILKNPSSQEIWQLAMSQGAMTLFEDGIDKVKNGVTTLEELLRVAEAPETVSIPTKTTAAAKAKKSKTKKRSSQAKTIRPKPIKAKSIPKKKKVVSRKIAVKTELPSEPKATDSEVPITAPEPGNKQ